MGGIRASHQLELLVNALFGAGSPCMLIVPQVDKKFDRKVNCWMKVSLIIFTIASEYLLLPESLVQEKIAA